MSNPVGAPAVGNFSNVQLAHVYQSYQQQPSQNPRFSQQVSLPAQMGYYQQHAQPQLVRQQSESGIQHHTQIQQHILTMQQQQQQQVVLAQQEINSASPVIFSQLKLLLTHPSILLVPARQHELFA
ncbi:unnamed protein product [Protopolystoma xenopodis]|uniref:Uncharacterized protein n=1 Tax=Protopolystoma xenopodis TaxID=117903 RepID=A0A3S5C282_9PLAT|nr:unnamed protein product [Protopolystoma xenopodis]